MRGKLIKVINNIPITWYEHSRMQNGQVIKSTVYAALDPKQRECTLATAPDLKQIELFCRQQEQYKQLNDYRFANVLELAEYMKPYLKHEVQFEDIYLNMWVNMTFNQEVKHNDGSKTLHFYAFALSQFDKAPGIMDIKIVHYKSEFRYGEQHHTNNNREISDVPISIGNFKEHCSKLLSGVYE